MDSLAGQKLLRKSGSVTCADEALEGKKVVLFYFSAHWNPPCAVFTPVLNDFYQVQTKPRCNLVLSTDINHKSGVQLFSGTDQGG